MEQCSSVYCCNYIDASAQYKHIQNLFCSLNEFALLMSSRPTGPLSNELTLSVSGLFILVQARA